MGWPICPRTSQSDSPCIPRLRQSEMRHTFTFNYTQTKNTFYKLHSANCLEIPRESENVMKVAISCFKVTVELQISNKAITT